MTQEVFGLRYEFVYRHGHYMELYKEDGLDSKELSTLQVRMLEANQIPKLLPMEIQEVDFRVSLLYNLSAKRMLAHVLKIEGLSKHQFVKLMFAIACALEESKNYMLYETGYVLKDNFIFIGSDWSDVYLTYIPLEPMSEEGSVFTSIETLMRQLALKIKEEERKELEPWLSSITPIQSLQGYKESLLTLMDEQSPVQEVMLTANQGNLPKPLWKQNDVNRPVHMHPSIEWGAKSNMETISNEKAIHPISFTPLHKRSQMITLAVVILLAAFLWQSYFTYPSTGTLQITTGVTILLIDAWFVIRFLGLPRYKKEHKKKAHLSSKTEIEKQLEDTLEPSASESMNIQTYYQNLHMHTTILSNKEPNATVFLGRVTNKSLGPRIEVQREGIVKTVPFHHDHFTIGRGDANLKVDYLLEEAGVSRVHAEIVKSDEGYEIKDTGSTNGTYLNGESLVSYQSYPLKDGDEIRIVRQEMKFRM